MEKFIEYEDKIMRTASDTNFTKETLCIGALGLTGEAGEVADYIKKVLFHSHQLSKEKLAEELGDVLWYLTYLTNISGYSLSEIAELNIKKLGKRYPEGWSVERSINREEEFL